MATIREYRSAAGRAVYAVVAGPPRSDGDGVLAWLGFDDTIAKAAEALRGQLRKGRALESSAPDPLSLALERRPRAAGGGAGAAATGNRPAV